MRNIFTRKSLLNRSLVIHPFLFAVFAILFLYAHNISETTANQIFMPILFSTLATFLLWVLLSFLLKDKMKAGLATTLFVFLFFSYGRFYELLERWDVFVPKHGVLLPAVLLLWGYGVYFLKKARCDFKNTTRILNLVAIVLILVNLFTMVPHEIGGQGTASAQDTIENTGAQEGLTTQGPELGGMPDIYYIILDEYAHPDTMKAFYDYDNSDFVNNLVNKGFFVTRESRTRSAMTVRSIASSLNMEYISDTEPEEAVYQKLNNNKVVAFLKASGYKSVILGSQTEGDKWKMGADVYHNFYIEGASRNVSDFQRLLWNTTMLLPFYDYAVGGQFESYYRNGAIETLKYLKTMPQMEGPKFVFAHIYCPHSPFVFGPNGESIAPLNWENWKDRQFYLGQYVFITRQIEEVLNILLEGAKTSPVIIIQSDHGNRSLPGDECRKIFNAYYLPSGGTEDLHDSISPVNTFRLVFNHYFGTSYEFLEN